MVNPSFLFEVNMHVEVLQEVDHLKILNEANSIKVALDKGWSNMPDQVGLQGHKPDLNPLTEYENSCGRGHRMQYPENYFKYDLITPWKAIISASAVLNKKIIISADYEVIDYTFSEYS